MSVFTQKIDSIYYTKGVDAITSEINNALKDTGCAKLDDFVHPNQVECAIKLVKSFDDSVFPRCNHKIVEGLTQAGKTGVYTATIMFLKLYGLTSVLNVKTFYYISGDNAKDMTGKNAELIRKCFTEDFDCNFVALKNSDLRKDMKPEKLTNAMVFIDECHYGVEDIKNVLIKWEKAKGFNMHNDDDLVEKSLFIISNSATPFAEEMSDVACTKQIIKLTVKEWDEKFGYVGIKQYYQINAFIEGINRDSIREDCISIRNYLDDLKERTGKVKVAIARIYGGRYNRIKNELDKHFVVKEFFQSGKENIDYAKIELLLRDGPSEYITDKPLMIVVKGAYTMGNRIHPEAKKNIGAIYDVKTNCVGKYERKGIVSTIQGLLGRITGYWNTDDWKDIRIWIHDAARKKMRGYYYEEASSSPVSSNKMVFVPNENGVIGIKEASDSITYYGVPEFNGNIKESVIEYLESKDEKYKHMVQAIGRRYTKKGHQTIAYFSADSDIDNIRVESNIGKLCYTFLYDEKEHTIEVLYGTIMKGYYKNVEGSINPVQTLLTTPRTIFQPDPNGTELDFVCIEKDIEFTNVPKLGTAKNYKDDIVEYLENADPRYKEYTCLSRRRNSEYSPNEHFVTPHISRAAAETGRYGANVLSEENVGKIYYSFLYDTELNVIRVEISKLVKGNYEIIYPTIQPVKTLVTMKR